MKTVVWPLEPFWRHPISLYARNEVEICSGKRDAEGTILEEQVSYSSGVISHPIIGCSLCNVPL